MVEYKLIGHRLLPFLPFIIVAAAVAVAIYHVAFFR
jgi:hypothetical protein